LIKNSDKYVKSLETINPLDFQFFINV